MDKNSEDHLVTLAKVFAKSREGNLKYGPVNLSLLQTNIKF